jgi:phosphopantetheine adenylyltransferase
VAGRAAILDCSNVVLVEGDIIGYPLERYAALRELLAQITGDHYEVGIVHDPLGGGVSEPESNYCITTAELVD